MSQCPFFSMHFAINHSVKFIFITMTAYDSSLSDLKFGPIICSIATTNLYLIDIFMDK